MTEYPYCNCNKTKNWYIKIKLRRRKKYAFFCYVCELLFENINARGLDVFMMTCYIYYICERHIGAIFFASLSVDIKMCIVTFLHN